MSSVAVSSFSPALDSGFEEEFYEFIRWKGKDILEIVEEGVGGLGSGVVDGETVGVEENMALYLGNLAKTLFFFTERNVISSQA